jgi:glucose-1-phosphate thymidylyltransferase
VKHNTIAFGFPDILFGPDDVFEQLHARMDDADAELVLGLYPATEPADVDMVDLDNTGHVRGIFLKPKSTTLSFTWTCAVWRPGFTEIMHDAVKAAHASAESSPSAYEGLDAQGDFPVGAVIKRAIEANLRVCGVAFEDQTFLDIGTPRSLARALRR